MEGDVSFGPDEQVPTSSSNADEIYEAEVKETRMEALVDSELKEEGWLSGLKSDDHEMHKPVPQLMMMSFRIALFLAAK